MINSILSLKAGGGNLHLERGHHNRLEELKQHTPISLEEQKQILLNIMDEIDFFCKSNKLTYYLAYGTLIGAIRHKGYIPWDDDIDIWMPRKDYEIFVEFFRNNRKDNLDVIDYSTKGYYLPFAKVINNNTIVLEYTVNRPIELGMYIDIFPLDYCGNNQVSFWKEYKRKMGIEKYIHSIKNTRLDKKRIWYKKIAICILKIVFIPFSRDELNRSLDKKAQLFGTENDSRYIGSIVMPPYGKKEVYEKKWFGDGKGYQFEGRVFNIPENYHEILTQIYGDYMKIPSEDKRQSLHNFVAYWK